MGQWSRRLRARNQSNAAAQVPGAGNRANNQSRSTGVQSNLLPWQCRTCHWMHSPSHTECSWCKRRQQQRQQPRMPQHGDGPQSAAWDPASEHGASSAAQAFRAPAVHHYKTYAAAVSGACGNDTANTSGGSMSANDASTMQGPTVDELQSHLQQTRQLFGDSHQISAEIAEKLRAAEADAEAAAQRDKQRLSLPPTLAELTSAEAKLRNANAALEKADRAVLLAKQALEAAEQAREETADAVQHQSDKVANMRRHYGSQHEDAPQLDHSARSIASAEQLAEELHRCYSNFKAGAAMEDDFLEVLQRFRRPPREATPEREPDLYGDSATMYDGAAAPSATAFKRPRVSSQERAAVQSLQMLPPRGREGVQHPSALARRSRSAHRSRSPRLSS